MKIEDLLGKHGEWLKSSGPESDIVISTRIRLARNLANFPFLTLASPQTRSEIESYIKERLLRNELPKKIFYLSLHNIDHIDRMLLAERHLISREHALGEGARGVAIAYDETLSIMVNEEDHLRIQVLRSGMLFNEAYEEADITDSILGSSLNYAFSPQFGFLTACPTNVGTGLRVSVLVHLPALALVKQMEKVFQSLSHINYTMRGLFGEGTLPIGNFYQISNQISLGKSELDIINEMKSVIPQIVQYERVWRQKLLDEEKGQIEDRIWRANGILRNAHIITSEETMELLSALRLGINLGLIEDIDMNTLNELFMSTQPSHLQKMEGRVLEPEERDTMRASFIREKLISNAR